jgi:hypothetical protein
MKTTDAQQRDKDLKFYLDTFKGNECLCGRGKQPKYWFCFRCYKALPHDMQRALWEKMGNGGRQAFEDAVKWLQEEIWD